MNPRRNGDVHFANGVGQQQQGYSAYRPAIQNGRHVTASTSPARRARHPDYEDKSNRLFSFVHWRYPHVQDPTKLVTQGFFFTGEADLVRCFHCSIGLKDFIQSDDPLIEHIKYSEDCDFLVQLLGPNRLRQLKDSIIHNHAPPDSNILTETLNELSELGENRPEINETRREITEVRHHGSNTQRHPRVPHSTLTSTSPAVPHYRHPEYSSCSIRVASFTGWPTHLTQTPQSLAEAGFYYTGTGDVVRCYSCDGGLQKWDPHDDPWIEHCINFPTCTHLKQTKGDDYIALAKAHRQQPMGIRPNEAVEQKFRNLRVHDNHERNPDEVKQDVVKITIVSMGYTVKDFNSAVANLIKELKEPSVENIIDEIERQRHEGVQEPKDLLKEHNKLKTQLFCMECKTAETNSLFLPCQHHRMCTSCSATLSQCPLCGGNIVQKIKTYRP